MGRLDLSKSVIVDEDGREWGTVDDIVELHLDDILESEVTVDPLNPLQNRKALTFTFNIRPKPRELLILVKKIEKYVLYGWRAKGPVRKRAIIRAGKERESCLV